MNQPPAAPDQASPTGPGPDPVVPEAAAPAGQSAVRRLWAVFRREPMLLVTCSYLFVSFVGLWDSYWFYRRFDIPVLEYLQSSDYFVAGLRRPAYIAFLAWTLLASVLALWPEMFRARNPERAARLDARWWFRAIFPKRGDWWAYFGLHPETMTTLTALVVMGLLLFFHGNQRADAIRAGEGNPVAVQGSDGSTLLDARMLGTSSAYVFLWDPAGQRAEVVPIESVARIRPLPAVPVRDEAPAEGAGAAQ